MVTTVSSPPLFPSFVAQHSVAFSLHEASELSDEFPGIALADSLCGAVRKRRVEFLAGRLCVREALRACAPEYVGTRIDSGDAREPVWPSGIVGSIAHCDGFASAALASTRDARGIGLDVEHPMPDERAARLLKRIAAAEELAPLASQPGWSLGLALTLVFSAKEALFKCLYPHARRYFDFREASVEWINADRSSFGVRLLRDLAPALPTDFKLDGRFQYDERALCTAIVWTGPASADLG